jgi:hypothetical protein
MPANMRHNLGVLMLHGPIDSLALEVHHRSCVRTRFQSKKTSRSPVLTDTLEKLEIPVLMGPDGMGEHNRPAILVKSDPCGNAPVLNAPVTSSPLRDIGCSMRQRTRSTGASLIGSRSADGGAAEPSPAPTPSSVGRVHGAPCRSAYIDRCDEHDSNSAAGRISSPIRRDENTSGFCLGDTSTMAYCCLVPQFYNACRFECDRRVRAEWS